MINKLLLLCILGGVAADFYAEDIGQKIASYGIKGNRKLWEEDRFGNRTNFEYDNAGQLIGVIRAGKKIAAFTYKDGLLRKKINSSGSVIELSYDSQGNIKEQTAFSGKTIWQYDKVGRVIEHSGAGQYPIKYIFNNWGELASYIDGNGFQTQLNYNGNGKLISRIWPDGTKVKYSYQNERVISKEEAGRKTIFEYDSYGRLIKEKITYADQSFTTYWTYDTAGNISSISNGKDVVEFAYDSWGRKLEEKGPIGKILFFYDKQGRMIAQEAQLKKSRRKFLTQYAYDQFDRLISVKSPSGEFKYTWTKDNKIASLSIGDKIISYFYDYAGRLSSKTYNGSVFVKYEYDKMDRRIRGQYFDVVWDYNYDQYSQLIEAKNSMGDNYQYHYDSIGNCLSIKENDKTTNYSYNSLNQISDSAYTYDSWGNLIKSPEAEYVYDLKDRLIQVKKLDGTVIDYKYDPLSQRICSIVNGIKRTDFLMSGMIEYARDDGKAQFHTLGLDILNSQEKSGGVGAILATNNQFYLYDGNGNVMGVIEKGALTSTITYTPTGQQTSGKILPFLFSSKALDESGLSYYGYRFFNSRLAKWMSRDPLVELGGINQYCIVGNQFNNKTDYMGLSPMTVPLCIVQSGLQELVGQYYNNVFDRAFTVGSIRRYCQAKLKLPPTTEFLTGGRLTQLSISTAVANALKSCLVKVEGFENFVSVEASSTIDSGSYIRCSSDKRRVMYEVGVKTVINVKLADSTIKTIWQDTRPERGNSTIPASACCCLE